MSADKDRIAELESKLEYMSKLATPAEFTLSENSRLRSKITELERKLAEQQTLLVTHRECMEYMLDICINIHKVDFPQTQKLLAKDISAEELNNLLAKAKEEGRKEAVQVRIDLLNWLSDCGYLTEEATALHKDSLISAACIQNVRDERDMYKKHRDTLLDAGKALVDRWDTPSWKDAPHTGEFIVTLRAAIEAIESPTKRKAA